ncbi:MAG: rhomboid family intramembrane serine protease [Proteobacteria bacterium]|nr:rhomboid family intramembrane serine protease [Pseudomonadota bacterium]
MQQPTREPAINLPPVTLAMIAANIAAFAAVRLLAGGKAWEAYDAFGFIPARYLGDPAAGAALVYTPLTYLFLHGDWVHLAVNMVSLAAFGAGIERRVGGITMLSIYLLSGVLAAAAHFAVYPDSVDPVIGASGAISGLMGGVLRLMREARGSRGGGMLGFALVWAASTVLLGLTGLPGEGGAPIAWVAHLGGFVAGLVLFGFFIGNGRSDEKT